MEFKQMNAIQRRLHNAAIVLGSGGDEYGFEQLQRDAIHEIALLNEMNAQLREQNTLVDRACARREQIEAAARRVVAAFETLGTAQHAGSLLMERGNCETAMVALKEALFNTTMSAAPRSVD